MKYSIPPAGNPIALTKGGDLPRFNGYGTTWLNSGTAALSFALSTARARQPENDQPEAIIPAYGCPDLVSAALHAGVTPVLCDIGPGDPAFSTSEIAARITPRTVAVVAVNFLGIAERLDSLRTLIADTGRRIALIEDNAQWFPEPVERPGLSGDLVCLSFGRGKPVNLLGGGALLASEGFLEHVPVIARRNRSAAFRTRTRARLFNVATRPVLYHWISRMPLTGLGSTEFHPLREVALMSPDRLDLLPGNVRCHLQRPRLAEQQIREMIASLDMQHLVVDLALNSGGRAGRLLRYPVLLPNRHIRDLVYQALRREGLGATTFYSHPVTELKGISPGVAVPGTYSGARSFADRLITLPTHAGVDQSHVGRMREVIDGTLRSLPTP
jgi:dTDP-4-amino-4,6-dideoxygalactose transaminase